MDRYLLFQLYGPLASWGDTAVGEVRPTLPHPGKSAIIGLLAAAFGIRRDEQERLDALEAGYRLAVRIDHPGLPLRDYHTVQVPPRAAIKGHPHRTRRDELSALALYQRQHGGAGTLLTYREYRCDAYAVAALTATETAPESLERCTDALLHPRFPLYLGRKSCPPALPLQPHIATASSLRETSSKADFQTPEDLAPIPRSENYAFYWEDGMQSGFQETDDIKTFTRRDRPLSRRRWQFATRAEHHATASREE